MKQAVALLSLFLSLMAGVSIATAQQPAGTPQAGGRDGLAISIDVDAPTASKFGFIRTTIAPGGSFRFSAGSGPAVRFVEQGALRLSAADAGLTIVTPSSATPEMSPAGDHAVESGAAFLVDAGGSIELRNDGADPATVLELLTASDATVTDETDVSRLVLAQRDYALPAGTVTITLSQQSLEPGDHFDWPADPATTTLFPLDRADSFLLTAQGFNRGTHPIAFYVLTIAPENT
jgi:hypothetical protein